MIQTLNAFKIERIDDYDYDDEAEYSSTSSANCVSSAYSLIKDEHCKPEYILTNFAIYSNYISNKGISQLSYDEALYILPSEGTPFYKVAKDWVESAKQSLADLKAARTLICKLFKILPKDTYRYDDIEKIYKDLLNMYAYETVFGYYYM